MAGHVYLITGGAGGIGSSLAQILVERGDKVVLFGRRVEPLEALALDLGGAASAFAVAGDATRAADLDQAVAAAVEQFGRLDGLAHCVGSIVRFWPRGRWSIMFACMEAGRLCWSVRWLRPRV